MLAAVAATDAPLLMMIMMMMMMTQWRSLPLLAIRHSNRVENF